MFDVVIKNGELRLKRSRRHREPGERGIWIAIAEKGEIGSGRIIRLNRENGIDVLEDEHGMYRALVLKD